MPALSAADHVERGIVADVQHLLRLHVHRAAAAWKMRGSGLPTPNSRAEIAALK
jgi:hypothetical protein